MEYNIIELFGHSRRESQLPLGLLGRKYKALRIVLSLTLCISMYKIGTKQLGYSNYVCFSQVTLKNVPGTELSTVKGSRVLMQVEMSINDQTTENLGDVENEFPLKVNIFFMFYMKKNGFHGICINKTCKVTKQNIVGRR